MSTKQQTQKKNSPKFPSKKPPLTHLGHMTPLETKIKELPTTNTASAVINKTSITTIIDKAAEIPLEASEVTRLEALLAVASAASRTSEAMKNNLRTSGKELTSFSAEAADERPIRAKKQRI